MSFSINLNLNLVNLVSFNREFVDVCAWIRSIICFSYNGYMHIHVFRMSICGCRQVSLLLQLFMVSGNVVFKGPIIC